MRTIQISEETFDRLKDQLVGAKEIGVLDDMVGQSFFFRTVTFYLVGKVVRRAVEADMLPLGTVVDCGTVADPIDGALIGHVRVKDTSGWTGPRHANKVGARILYVPLEEP